VMMDALAPSCVSGVFLPRVDERLMLAIYFLQKMEKAQMYGLGLVAYLGREQAHPEIYVLYPTELQASF
jgi:hypothetical protein